jgi:hypothetical protein
MPWEAFMWSKLIRTAVVGLVTSTCFASATQVGLGGTDDFLKQLLTDPDYGRLNVLVADEIGADLTPQKLGVELGTLNVLAKKAKLPEDKESHVSVPARHQRFGCRIKGTRGIQNPYHT